MAGLLTTKGTYTQVGRWILTDSRSEISAFSCDFSPTSTQANVLVTYTFPVPNCGKHLLALACLYLLAVAIIHVQYNMPIALRGPAVMLSSFTYFAKILLVGGKSLVTRLVDACR